LAWNDTQKQKHVILLRTNFNKIVLRTMYLQLNQEYINSNSF